MDGPDTDKPPQVIDPNNDFQPLINPNTYSFSNLRLIEPNLPTSPMNLPRDILDNEELASKLQYANIVMDSNKDNMTKPFIEHIPLKKLTYNNGVPRIVWTEDEMRE